MAYEETSVEDFLEHVATRMETVISPTSRSDGYPGKVAEPLVCNVRYLQYSHHRVAIKK